MTASGGIERIIKIVRSVNMIRTIILSIRQSSFEWLRLPPAEAAPAVSAERQPLIDQ